MVDLEALARECGVQLYDVETVSENGRTIYRISITKAGGVGLDDCERLSRLLSPIYDVEPPLEGEVLGCEGGVLRLRTDGGEVSMRLDEIKKARTYVQW